MSVVRINAITVPPERAEELAGRFAARAGEVGKSEGFEEFQLLRPSDERNTWLVYTRWRDEESFEKWLSSMAFSRAHGSQPAGQHAGRGPGAETGPAAAGQGHGEPSQAGGASHPGSGAGGASHPGSGAGAHGQGGPVATGSELWSFTVEQRETAGP